MDPGPCTLHPLHNNDNNNNQNTNNSDITGCEENHFTACHSGKLKLAFTSPNVISASPKDFLTSRIDFILLFEFLKKHHLPVGQVKNRIH